MNKDGAFLQGGIIPLLSKRDWRLNKKCCVTFLATTVAFVLVAVSIGCYFYAARNYDQLDSFKQYGVANVTRSPSFGKVSYSKCIYWRWFSICFSFINDPQHKINVDKFSLMQGKTLVKRLASLQGCAKYSLNGSLDLSKLYKEFRKHLFSPRKCLLMCLQPKMWLAYPNSIRLYLLENDMGTFSVKINFVNMQRYK